ncbi:ribonuclease H [Pyrrhoderma noxium]|uniref:Ribonuclease H n=1 Tax=Pyrrhoderma noxium TaxID=2282107 RepID=A0A286UXH2_9AGAM|nr:ribonuclease H [Pyrrhoderma noxium]
MLQLRKVVAVHRPNRNQVLRLYGNLNKASTIQNKIFSLLSNPSVLAAAAPASIITRTASTGSSRFLHNTSSRQEQGEGTGAKQENMASGQEPDEIMEIAVLITDGNLELVDDGIQFILNVQKEKLDSMDSWCTRQHGSTGLTQACLESPDTLESVQISVLEYIKKYIPGKRVGVLAGNSVHVDRMFLAEKMPILLEHLHYRIVDVSSIKELCRRWYNGLSAPKTLPEKEAHRALADIRASVDELKWYRKTIFKPTEDSSK